MHGEIQGLAHDTEVNVHLVKTNPKLAQAALSEFGAITIGTTAQTRQEMLQQINTSLPFSPEESMNDSLSKLSEAGLDISEPSSGEMRGVNLIKAWNMYHKNNSGKTFWDFLASPPPSIYTVKKIQQMDFALVFCIEILTEVVGLSYKIVGDYGLIELAVEAVCEKAQHLHNQ